MTSISSTVSDVERTGLEAQVLSKATLRAAAFLGVPSSVLANVIGLSGATLTRMKQGKYCLKHGEKPFELAVLFVRLFRGLDAITGGDDEAARSWLHGENRALGHRRPIDLIQSVAGLMETIAYVDSRRAPL